MNPETYSTYEAKARLSELLRKVRAGQIITLTHRGQPIAELRPVQSSGSDLETRLRALAEVGVLQRCSDRPMEPTTLISRAGALQRFLQERDEA